VKNLKNTPCSAATLFHIMLLAKAENLRGPGTASPVIAPSKHIRDAQTFSDLGRIRAIRVYEKAN
jgi:hypothetical protein